MRAKIIEQLKVAREFYMVHHTSNRTQDRGLCLLYWGNECLKLRAKLAACDV